MVASVEAISVESMPRGMGGRIEEAFKAAKENGEAAFVTFVTAGYPTKEGKDARTLPSSATFIVLSISASKALELTFTDTVVVVIHRHTRHSHGHARGRSLHH